MLEPTTIALLRPPVWFCDDNSASSDDGCGDSATGSTAPSLDGACLHRGNSNSNSPRAYRPLSSATPEFPHSETAPANLHWRTIETFTSSAEDARTSVSADRGSSSNEPRAFRPSLSSILVIPQSESDPAEDVRASEIVCCLSSNSSSRCSRCNAHAPRSSPSTLAFPHNSHHPPPFPYLLLCPANRELSAPPNARALPGAHHLPSTLLDDTA